MEHVPMGFVVWEYTFSQLTKELPSRCDSKREPNYTLSGFVYAFKIWIVETFPYNLTHYTRDLDVIHRAVGYARKMLLNWEKVLHLIRREMEATIVRELVPRDGERACEWWIDSSRYSLGSPAMSASCPPFGRSQSYSRSNDQAHSSKSRRKSNVDLPSHEAKSSSGWVTRREFEAYKNSVEIQSRTYNKSLWKQIEEYVAKKVNAARCGSKSEADVFHASPVGPTPTRTHRSSLHRPAIHRSSLRPWLHRSVLHFIVNLRHRMPLPSRLLLKGFASVCRNLVICY